MTSQGVVTIREVTAIVMSAVIVKSASSRSRATNLDKTREKKAVPRLSWAVSTAGIAVVTGLTFTVLSQFLGPSPAGAQTIGLCDTAAVEQFSDVKLATTVQHTFYACGHRVCRSGVATVPMGGAWN